jgi:hypothetical protein
LYIVLLKYSRIKVNSRRQGNYQTLSDVEHLVMEYVTYINNISLLNIWYRSYWPTQTTPSQGEKLVYLQEEKPYSWVGGGKPL